MNDRHKTNQKKNWNIRGKAEIKTRFTKKKKFKQMQRSTTVLRHNIPRIRFIELK